MLFFPNVRAGPNAWNNRDEVRYKFGKLYPHVVFWTKPVSALRSCSCISLERCFADMRMETEVATSQLHLECVETFPSDQPES
jgi:hypothetical protein